MVAMVNSSFFMQVRRERAVLGLMGAETEHFLQNLVTADVQGMADHEARYGALLTPQGKILFDFFMVRFADGFLLDCAASQIAELEKRLKFYRLRAKIDIAARPDLEVGVSPEKPEGVMLSFKDPRSPAIGWRIIAKSGRLPEGAGYEAARIALGLADSEADIGSGELFPHEANLDRLAGLSFTKGCYIGQEVVARMQHRGTARSRILTIAFDGAPPTKASHIKSGDKVVGNVLSSSGNRALALLRLDAAEAPLLTEGVVTRVQKT